MIEKLTWRGTSHSHHADADPNTFRNIQDTRYILRGRVGGWVVGGGVHFERDRVCLTDYAARVSEILHRDTPPPSTRFYMTLHVPSSTPPLSTDTVNTRAHASQTLRCACTRPASDTISGACFAHRTTSVAARTMPVQRASHLHICACECAPASAAFAAARALP